MNISWLNELYKHLEDYVPQVDTKFTTKLNSKDWQRLAPFYDFWSLIHIPPNRRVRVSITDRFTSKRCNYSDSNNPRAVVYGSSHCMQFVVEIPSGHSDSQCNAMPFSCEVCSLC